MVWERHETVYEFAATPLLEGVGVAISGDEETLRFHHGDHRP
jgi:hypothetical protein